MKMAWDVVESKLTDGSEVYDVVGRNQDGDRVRINCTDLDGASQILRLLNTYAVDFTCKELAPSPSSWNC